jgi:hypothetical protein
MIAALPVLAVGCETDWSRFYDGPGSRAELRVGEDFIKTNGPAAVLLRSLSLHPVQSDCGTSATS